MPVLAAVIIVSLAIGIGVNTTIFSWIQMILFEPMPPSVCANFLLAEPRTETGGYPGASWLEYATCRLKCRRCGTSWHLNGAFNVGEKGQTERTHGQLVSGNYFSALGQACGRTIYSPEEG